MTLSKSPSKLKSEGHQWWLDSGTGVAALNGSYVETARNDACGQER